MAPKPPSWALVCTSPFLACHSCRGQSSNPTAPLTALGPCCGQLWGLLSSKSPAPAPDCLPHQPSPDPYSSLRNELYHAGLVWSSGSFPSHMCDHGDDPGDGHTNSSRSYSRTRSLGGKPGFLIRLLPRTLLDQRPLEGTELFFSLFRFLLLHLL